MEKESYRIQKELESMRKVLPFTHYTCRASKNKVVKKYIKKAVYTLLTGLVFFPNNLTANKKTRNSTFLQRPYKISLTHWCTAHRNHSCPTRTQLQLIFYDSFWVEMERQQ